MSIKSLVNSESTSSREGKPVSLLYCNAYIGGDEVKVLLLDAKENAHLLVHYIDLQACWLLCYNKHFSGFCQLFRFLSVV